ncbi:hypothetical protein RN001_012110 [Aquatica leii]|uniref:Mitochondrial import receptor subunit TOM22 homolog n=1 Tax=Aquatica leii TaxID=1421715 RepID=A0AAN7QEJ6_9COLE|nr:hypothetical protein RN001_012110 [Aquatica leii]
MTPGDDTDSGMESQDGRFYGFSRSAFWIIFSSSIILFAPVIFEVERVQMEEAQRTQQKQMLLGPNTAVSGGALPLMPPIRH